MRIEELRQKVFEDLYSRGLADPSIRKRALNKILSFIGNVETFYKDKELFLPSDKVSLKTAYQEWKGAKLNQAENSVINTMYEHYTGNKKSFKAKLLNNTNTLNLGSNRLGISIKEIDKDVIDSIEENLLNGVFIEISDLKIEEKIPNVSGIYCIKLKNDIEFPRDFGEIRKDGIIYIGMASQSLKKRLWEEELNHKKAATFFLSIGAMLGFLPPKGTLAGKKNSRNYKFSVEDTEKIKNWMKESLLVSFVQLKETKEKIEEIEKSLIKKFSPLVNIEHNEKKSKALVEARAKCVQWANMKE